MQQFPSQQNPLKFHQAPLPKIKPILRRCYKPYQLDEINNQKTLKAHSKTLMNIRVHSRKTIDSSQYIKRRMNSLKAQDSLSKLSYSFRNNLCFENVYLFSKIRGLRNLTSLDVHFLTNKHHMHLEVLFRSLAHLKDLTHFQIELHKYSFIDADRQILHILFQSLRRLKNLKSFSLTFRTCSNFQNAKVNHLPQYLSHLKQLQSLELNFNESVELTEQDITNIASVFPKLPLLTQISLDFGLQMRIIQGSTLVQVFQNMSNLSGITMNLTNAQIMKKERTDPLSEGLRLLHAPSLKKLDLHLHRNLDNQSLIELSRTIERFTSLNILNVNLYACETNEGATELGLALNSLTTLSSFDFRVQYSFQTGSLVGCIASGLKSLRNLINLKLDFINTKVCPDQIQQLSASLVGMSSLKFLYLRFYSVQSLSDDALTKLSEGLRKLTQLKHLTLEFSYSQMNGKKGVETVASAIQELHGLTFLDLNVIQNGKINDQTIKKIAQALRHLSSLNSTCLRFTKCVKLDQKEGSFSSLFNALRELENIREVDLCVPYSKTNSNEAIDLQKRKVLTISFLS